ncbi:MAG: PH domain-containing protein [Chloroflexi bacterium]|nr:PH domain-containing protein [Chloroflexota bacterium]
MERVKFRPKWDWWQALLLVGGCLAPIVALIFSPELPLFAKAGFALFFGALLWILISVCYEVRGDGLVVSVGPIRLHYPWADVSRVRKGGWWAQVSSFREPRMRMAFSTDNIIIECQSGRRAKRVVVSVKDRTRFLSLIRERAPQSLIEGF